MCPWSTWRYCESLKVLVAYSRNVRVRQLPSVFAGDPLHLPLMPSKHHQPPADGSGRGESPSACVAGTGRTPKAGLLSPSTVKEGVQRARRMEDISFAPMVNSGIPVAHAGRKQKTGDFRSARIARWGGSVVFSLVHCFRPLVGLMRSVVRSVGVT